MKLNKFNQIIRLDIICLSGKCNGFFLYSVSFAGDVERRFYKGVDTGERFIRMKPADADIKDVPSVLNLAGSKATLRIMKPDEIKELASACVPESAGEQHRRIL